MKRSLVVSFLASLLLSSTALAQLFQARLVTSAYSWQRLDAAGQAEDHLFGFQGVQLMLGSKKLTFRTYMQGFNDFGGPLESDPTFRLYTFLLKARDLAGLVDLQAGRFFMYSGAARGLMDGASATVNSGVYGLSFTGFYGMLAPADRTMNLSDSENSFMGVHVKANPATSLYVSASYSRKHFSQKSYDAVRSDTVFNPHIVTFRPDTRSEQLLSGDVRYEMHGYGDVYARYDYDIDTKETARLNAYGRFPVLGDLSLTAEYLQREPSISYQSIFSVFSYNTIRDVSAGIEYSLTDHWFLVANYGTISYGDDANQRITVGVNGNYVSASFSKNMSDHSDLDAASINAGFPFFDNLVTPTLLVSYAHYTFDKTAPTNDALGVAGGIVVRPMTQLSVDAQVQWMNNKVYKNDVRLFFRLSYALSHRLDLF